MFFITHNLILGTRLLTPVSVKSGAFFCGKKAFCYAGNLVACQPAWQALLEQDFIPAFVGKALDSGIIFCQPFFSFAYSARSVDAACGSFFMPILWMVSLV